MPFSGRFVWNCWFTVVVGYLTYRLFTYQGNYDSLPWPKWVSVSIAAIVLWVSLLHYWMNYLRQVEAGRKQ
jgi:hypothetical protein